MELRLRLWKFVGNWYRVEGANVKAPLTEGVEAGAVGSKTDWGPESCMDSILCGDVFADLFDVVGYERFDIVLAWEPFAEAHKCKYVPPNAVHVWGTDGEWVPFEITYGAKCLLTKIEAENREFYVGVAEVEDADARISIGAEWQ